jgi:tRNA (mo5U34)-methyltransferase
MTVVSDTDRVAQARRAVASNPFWYHTMELAPGVVTPGWFDLRPIVDRMPWPDVSGKRCLDVGTADGFLAFELERRGAGEVVATDVADHALWDYPVHIRERSAEFWKAVAGDAKKSEGFRIAKELLGSTVRPAEVSAYDLSPDTVGRFDVVVCGALLLHLRDPVRALEAMRSVCSGRLLMTNQVAVRFALMRRTPVATFAGATDQAQWWIPNPVANSRMVEAAGFIVERESRVYAIPFGAGHRPRSRGPRAAARRLLRRVISGGDGVPQHAVLARPAP